MKISYISILLLITLGCGHETTKEDAIKHFIEVYGIYHNDYQSNLVWSKPLEQVQKDMKNGIIADNSTLTTIQGDIKTGLETHKSSLAKLDKVKSIACKNNILEKAKESIIGQINTQNDLISYVELLKGGLAENEIEEFKKLSSRILTNANKIELWRDDLKAYRNEFNFTREDTKQIVDKFGL